MKKIISVLMIICIMVSLTACQSNSSSGSSETTTTGTPDFEVADGIEHDSSLDVVPEDGMKTGNTATSPYGDFYSYDDWCKLFAKYSYNGIELDFTENKTIGEIMEAFNLEPGDTFESVIDEAFDGESDKEIKLADANITDTQSLNVMTLSTTGDSKTNKKNAQKPYKDFIAESIYATEYYQKHIDNSFSVAGLRIGQCVSGKTFDELAKPTTITIDTLGFHFDSGAEETYYECVQDALDEAEDNKYVILHYISEPNEAEESSYFNYTSINDCYQMIVAISPTTNRIAYIGLYYLNK